MRCEKCGRPLFNLTNGGVYCPSCEAKMLKAREVAAKSMDWISVNDRLPIGEVEDGNEFLCVVLTPGTGGRYEKYLSILKYDYKKKEWDVFSRIVTHWMYLPEIPKEVKI